MVNSRKIRQNDGDTNVKSVRTSLRETKIHSLGDNLLCTVEKLTPQNGTKITLKNNTKR